MAILSISEWSTTAASNTELNGISLAENVMVPSAVNNYARETMAQVASYTRRGSDLATAATLNLDSVDTLWLNLTGTTTVTAVTLTSTHIRVCRAVGAFQLTASASLVVNGSTTTNYTTTADDLLWFEGYAAGVVRVYTMASATAAVSSFSDSVFRVQDNADATKQIAFEASGVTTGTTRTFTAPNASGTLALTSDLSAYQPLDADLTSWAAVTRAAGFDTFVATPSSANLAALVTDETGTGALVLATSPTLVTPALGTPASGVMTNVTGTATGLTSGITNALKSATTTVDVSAATAPTSGQVLTATSGTAATWQAAASSGPTLLTEQATTSGTTKDFTIPAGAKRITLMLNGVSFSGTGSRLAMQLGDSGGIEATGYDGGVMDAINADATVTVTSNTTQFSLTDDNVSQGDVWSGVVTLTRMNATHTWVLGGTVFVNAAVSGADGVFSSAGVKTLSAECTTLRILGGTFDAGAANVAWE